MKTTGLTPVCCLQEILATFRRLNTARSPVGPSRKFAGSGVPCFDLIPDSFHDRRDALRREDACRRDVVFADAVVVRSMDSLEQCMLVLPSQGLPELPEAVARLDGSALGISQLPGDDERVASVLGEQLVGLDVQRVREGVPHGLIDADDPARSLTLVERASKIDEKNGVALDRPDINRPIEWNRELRLQAEAVQAC